MISSLRCFGVAAVDEALLTEVLVASGTVFAADEAGVAFEATATLVDATFAVSEAGGVVAVLAAEDLDCPCIVVAAAGFASEVVVASSITGPEEQAVCFVSWTAAGFLSLAAASTELGEGATVSLDASFVVSS